MAQKIASLYAEIGADTKPFNKGITEVKQKLEISKKTIASDFASIAKGITGVTAAVGIMGGTFKTALEIGKAGANLEYLRDKFDKLSASVGTTGDVMLGKLRDATRGLVADSDLVASAGDLMALGLAKTEDQVVRLTRVAGGLGMDMNQIVLTLANQTTMRFDQLGVSVDGFDEKVRNLKATGMDANTAFKEAFLVQAEEQLKKVGEKADGSIASFARLEAAAKNLGDAFKLKLSPFLLKAADAALILMQWQDRVNGAYKEQEKQVRMTASSYEEYLDQVLSARIRAGEITQETKDHTIAMIENGNMVDVISDKYGVLSRDTWENQKATAYWGDAYRQLSDSVKGVPGELEKLQGAVGNAEQAIDGAVGAMKNLTKETLFNMAAANLDYESALDLAEAMGIVDEDSRTAYDAMQLLTDSFDSGKITAEQYRRYVLGLGDSLDSIDGRTANMVVNIITHGRIPKIGGQGGVTVMGNTTVGGAGTSSGQTYTGANQSPGVFWGNATGADFIVPPGYNDTYPVKVKSGEHVKVTPAGQPNDSGVQLAAILSALNTLDKRIGRSVRDAMAGAA